MRIGMTMKQYIDSVIAPSATSSSVDGQSPPYLRLWHFEETHPQFREDYVIPDYFTDHTEKLPAKYRPSPAPHWLFLGPANTHTPLHLDPWCTHAWFAQLRGRKQFVLFRPCDTTHVCNGTEFADVDRPDLEKFPTFGSAVPISCVVEPGDVLFLPCGWAHSVTSLDRSISLTHNYLDEEHFKVVRMAFLMSVIGKNVAAAQQRVDEDEMEEHIAKDAAQ